MNNERQRIEGMLPAQAAELFKDVADVRVLGAANHIARIGEIIKVISGTADPIAAVKATREVCDYFKRTRGSDSRAVYNAIVMMTEGVLNDQSLPVAQIPAALSESVDAYQAVTHKKEQAIFDYARAFSKNMRKIMVFDYSSTVCHFLERLDRGVEVVIPESRYLDGGKPFVATCQKASLKIKFIYDVNMLIELEGCDAAFIGAETFFPDGTAYNTTGSDLLAVLCKERQVPYIVITPMIKLDMRSSELRQNAIKHRDQSNKLASGWSESQKDSVDFTAVGLVGIAPSYITYFITEYGIIPPQSIRDAAAKYGEEIGEKLDV